MKKNILGLAVMGAIIFVLFTVGIAVAEKTACDTCDIRMSKTTDIVEFKSGSEKTVCFEFKLLFVLDLNRNIICEVKTTDEKSGVVKLKAGHYIIFSGDPIKQE
jgi:hypothetical protein